MTSAVEVGMAKANMVARSAIKAIDHLPLFRILLV
jgi:hypothetical protein